MTGLSYLRKKFTGLLSIMATVLLVACSGEPRPELSIESVSIYADPDANQNSALAVDLVLVYDLELVKTLSKMSAAKYFSDAKQLLLDNPTLLDIWHWELVPGQIVDNFTPDQDDGDSFAAFVFANYLTDGDHRVKVAPDGVVKIILQRDDLKNFAIFNATDPKAGKTVTDLINSDVGSSGNSPLCTKVKRGPVKYVTNPCKKMMPKPCPPPVVCCPPRGKPMLITKRPLAPPLAIKPCPKNKVIR